MMNKVLSLFLLLISVLAHSEPPVLSSKELMNPPPRVIRACCSFGSEVKVTALPFVTITDITSLAAIGHHRFLGDRDEGNGIIYTERGGFIDLGHLRDVADWTGYLYAYMDSHRELPEELILGREGGKKVLSFTIDDCVSDVDLALIASRIAYELSTWHEIATWYGSSYVPLIPERFSSFSPEDLYSNLLGAHLGALAIQSNLGYDDVMTHLIDSTLTSLGAVASELETYNETELVMGDWWTRSKAIPNHQVLQKRFFGNQVLLSPWLVREDPATNACELGLPCASNEKLLGAYCLRIKAIHILPSDLKAILKNEEFLTHLDFQTIINYIEKDIACSTKPIRDAKLRRSRRRDI